MKAENVSDLGSYSTYGPDGSWLSRTNITSRSKTVTCGPVITGDFLKPNPFWYNVQETWHWLGEVAEYYPSPNRLWLRRHGWLGYADISAPPWDRDAAYNGALDKLYDQIRGNLDLAVAFAERNSTFRMLRGVAQVLSKASKVRTLGFGVANGSKAAADGWLSWQYGWRPLLSDIFGAADESVRTIISSCAKCRVRSTRPIAVNDLVSTGVFGYNGKANRVAKGFSTCIIEVNYAIDPERFQVSRWVSLNPLSLAWELTTLSFVADWFFDVGSFLRNLESALLYAPDFVSGYVSEYYQMDEEVEFNPSAPVCKTGLSYYRILSNTTWARRERRFVRTVLSSTPRPAWPSVKANLGSNQLLSAAALLRQLLK